MIKKLILTISVVLVIFCTAVTADNFGSKPSDKTVFTNALMQAEQGAPIEMYNVGYYYATGHGVKKDLKEAKRWFKKAEQTRNGAVHYKLGRLLETGLFFEKNMNKAIAHYQYSAKAEDPYGMNNFGSHLIRGQFIMKNEMEGVMWLEKSADLGMTEAMLNLAEYYREQKQLDNTILWLTKAAKANNVNGMLKLAKIYLTEKDYPNALLWYKSAANKNNNEAQLYLAMMTDKGLGIERSAEDARVWLEKSAKGGNLKAKRLLTLNAEKNKTKATLTNK
jgi:TPR repeat protein